MVSSESVPRSSSSSDKTTGPGSEPKKRKFAEDDEKSCDRDVDVLMETEDENSDTIEDDDEDDSMEVKQYSPKVTMVKRCSEDDEGYKAYVKKLADNECYDLDEDPLAEYLGPGYGVLKVHFDHPEHAHHKENVDLCIQFAIQQHDEDLKYVDRVSANYASDIGYVYFITFMAEYSSAVKTYQLEVLYDIWKYIKIKNFRAKPQKQEPQQLSS